MGYMHSNDLMLQEQQCKVVCFFVCMRSWWAYLHDFMSVSRPRFKDAIV